MTIRLRRKTHVEFVILGDSSNFRQNIETLFTCIYCVFIRQLVSESLESGLHCGCHIHNAIYTWLLCRCVHACVLMRIRFCIVCTYEILLNMDWFSFLSSIYAIFQCTFECAYQMCASVCVCLRFFYSGYSMRLQKYEKIVDAQQKGSFRFMSVFVDFSPFIQLISIFPIYFV